MATGGDYLEYVLSRLPEEVTYRPMMGEYILYYRGRFFGGIYDSRFLIRPVKTARMILPEAEMEIPYEGAKEMLSLPDSLSREFLQELLEAIYEELPEPKQRKKKQAESK